jgi:predicted glycosyltransferase
VATLPTAAVSLLARVHSVLFCNEMLGLGHLRLSLAVAEALVAQGDGSSALVVTGSTAFGGWRLPQGVDILKLPTLPVDAGSRWSATAHRPSAGLAVGSDEVRALRSELALTTVAQLRPDVVLVDYLPLGRDDELRPALELLRAHGGCTTALGLWDVDDAPERLRERWTGEPLDTVAALYDLALVYGASPPGDVRVEGLRSVGVPVHHTGLVGVPVAEHGPADLGEGYLLATAGGGVDGFALLDALLDTLPGRPLPVPTVLVTGPMMAAGEIARLRERAAGLDVRVEEFRPDMDAVLAGARAVVSMAGYNTVSEILGSGTPALLVPRTFPRVEQLNRARRWADAGCVEMLDPGSLEPARLREKISALLERPPGAGQQLTGAGDAAAILEDAHLATTARPRPSAPPARRG